MLRKNVLPKQNSYVRISVIAFGSESMVATGMSGQKLRWPLGTVTLDMTTPRPKSIHRCSAGMREILTAKKIACKPLWTETSLLSHSHKDSWAIWYQNSSEPLLLLSFYLLQTFYLSPWLADHSWPSKGGQTLENNQYSNAIFMIRAQLFQKE